MNENINKQGAGRKIVCHILIILTKPVDIGKFWLVNQGSNVSCYFVFMSVILTPNHKYFFTKYVISRLCQICIPVWGQGVEDKIN